MLRTEIACNRSLMAVLINSLFVLNNAVITSMLKILNKQPKAVVYFALLNVL